jgi:hypothetical protein
MLMRKMQPTFRRTGCIAPGKPRFVAATWFVAESLSIPAFGLDVVVDEDKQDLPLIWGDTALKDGHQIPRKSLDAWNQWLAFPRI